MLNLFNVHDYFGCNTTQISSASCFFHPILCSLLFVEGLRFHFLQELSWFTVKVMPFCDIVNKAVTDESPRLVCTACVDIASTIV
jgi:hypothetical protein